MNCTFRVITLTALCGGLVLNTACGRKGGPPPHRAMPVRTAVAVMTNAPVVIKAFGYTEGRENVDVVPQVSGVLVKSFVDDGAVVTNGQPLFQIDPSDYEMRVRQVEGVVEADRANLELSRTTLERNQPLLEKQLVSQEAFDTLKTRFEAVTAQLRMDEAMLDQARLNLARCTIRAPLAGVCSKRYVDNGNLVAAGASRLINIRSYDPIDLEFSVSEQYLPVLRKAMSGGEVKLEVLAEGDPNRHAGTLTFVDNAVNAQAGAITLRGQAPNPDLKMWARQFVNIRVFAGSVRNAVMVPEAAIQFGKMGPYLFVVSKDDKAEMRVVKPGIRYDGLIQIEQGVEAGEKVVTLGQLMLGPGTPVAEAGQRPAGGATNAVPGAAGK